MEDKTPNVPGHDLSQQAERDRQARAARVARINQDLLDRPREMKRQMGEQPSLRLRLRIAENLWNIMEEAQSRSPAVTRATILHEAPSVPMTLRQTAPGILDLRAPKDHLADAHASHPE